MRLPLSSRTAFLHWDAIEVDSTNWTLGLNRLGLQERVEAEAAEDVIAWLDADTTFFLLIFKTLRIEWLETDGTIIVEGLVTLFDFSNAFFVEVDSFARERANAVRTAKWNRHG